MGLSLLAPFPRRRDRCAQIWVCSLDCTLAFALMTAAVSLVAPPPLLCLKLELLEAEGRSVFQLHEDVASLRQMKIITKINLSLLWRILKW